MNISLPVYAYDADRAAGYQYDKLPRYYVFGGLVFTPLSLDYLRTLGRAAPESSFAESYYELYYRRYEDPKSTRPEPIVLASVLTDAVNANVGVRGRALIDQINGIRIQKLEDVVRAFETSTNTYDKIEFLPHNSSECLAHADVLKANPEILKTYGLASDRRL